MRWKTREELVNYLRDQAYWINELANEVESGSKTDCKWTVDLIPTDKWEAQLAEIAAQEQRGQAYDREVKTA